jgi:cytochrome P450
VSNLSSEIDLLSWRFAQDPHTTYARMRAEGGVQRQVVKTLATELNAWVVTAFDHGKALLTDTRLGKDVDELLRVMQARSVRPGDALARTPRSMLFSDPPDHTRLRKLVATAFTIRRVETMRPWIERTIADLLDDVVPGEEFDLVGKLGMALPIFVIGNLLGIPPGHHDDFRHWNATLASIDSPPEEKQRVHAQAFAYLRELIELKRSQPGDDMISALIQARDGESRLDEPELLATVFLLMNAGYETTANLISSGALALLTHPDQQALLRRDPSLVPGAVEEFLRLESPLNMATIRYTTSPVEVGDVTIPEDEIVFVALLAANRDPDKFADPDRLDVTRPGKGHLSFGQGLHHCIGAPLARLEGQVVFAELLARFAHWELAVPVDELTWKYSAQFRGLERLPVRLS